METFGLPSLPTCLPITIWIASIVAVMTTFIGAIVGFILAKTNILGKRIFALLILFGLMIPAQAHVASWLLLFGRNGILTPYITNFCPDFTIYSSFGVIFISSTAYLPLSTLIAWIGLYHGHHRLEEQASLYLSPIQRIYWIILPQMSYHLAISAVVVFILTAGDMTISDLLNIPTLARQVYLCLALYYRVDWAMVFVLPLLLVVATVTALLSLLLLRHDLARLGYISLSSMKMYLPQYILIPITLLAMPYLLAIPTLMYAGESISHFSFILQTTWSEIKHSIWIASWAGMVCVGMGTILSWWIWQRKFGWKIWIAITLIIFITPSNIMAIILLKSVNLWMEIKPLFPIASWLRDSDIPMIIGLVIRFLPYTIGIISCAFFQIPKQLCEQMSVLGCGHFRQFLHTLGIIKLAIVLSWLIAFGFCLGELEISILLIPPGISTLTIRIFTLMHYGIRSDVCWAMLILLMLIIVGILICLPLVWKLIRTYRTINRT